ncbi:MAG: hypothetical protein HY617_03735 [Candidatus Sungbacteria bacterium]|nr:hypothetical protein [Candidatus Sungbacteria bacterium]
MEDDIYKQKIAFFNEQLENIRAIQSDQTSRIGVMLTIAGLLSFLPQLISNASYLLHFLSWTLWLLAIAIFTYFPASLRISSIVKSHPFASSGSWLETEILKNRTEYLDIVWRITVPNHDSVMVWNNITKSFIYAYIFSVISNLYVFVFHGTPETCVSISILMMSLLIGAGLYIFPLMKSIKGKVIGDK